MREDVQELKCEGWYEEAKKITLEELPGFLNHLLNDYTHDYDTICHAISASALAVMHAINKSPQGGITGFQAQAIMWEIIKRWCYSDNKTALRIINYDNFLYPQYENYFEKLIPKRLWETIQKEANNKIQQVYTERSMVSSSVYSHWQSIVNGNMPFGYKVVDEIW